MAQNDLLLRLKLDDGLTAVLDKANASLGVFAAQVEKRMADAEAASRAAGAEIKRAMTGGANDAALAGLLREVEVMDRLVIAAQRRGAANEQAGALLQTLTLASLSGLERERAAFAASTDAIQQRIDAYSLEGVAVSELQGALQRLQTIQAQKIEQASDAQRVPVEERLIQVRAANLEMERRIAEATGNRAEAERKAAEIAALAASTTEQRNAREIAALREQFKGREDILAIIDQTEKALRRQSTLQRDFGGAQKSAAGLGEIERAALRASNGVQALSSQITSRLGPAGQVVGALTNEFGGMAGGIESVLAKAGLSASALIAIGGAAAGIGAVGAALFQAGKAAADLEKNLTPALAALIAGPVELEALKQATLNISDVTGVASDQVARAFSSLAASGTRDLNDLRSIVSAAAQGSRIGLGDVAQNAERLKAVLGTFHIPAEQAREVLARLNADALDGDTKFGEYVDTLVRVGQIGRELRVELGPLSDLLRSITAQEIPGTQAAAGISRALLVISDPENPTHKALEALGNDLSIARIEADGLLKVFEDIGRTTADRPDIRADFGGDARTAAAIFAALRVVTDSAASSSDRFSESLARLDEANKSVQTSGNLLSLAWNAVGNAFERAGDRALNVFLPAWLAVGRAAQQVDKAQAATGLAILDRIIPEKEVPVAVTPEIDLATLIGDIEEAAETAAAAVAGSDAAKIPFKLDPAFDIDPTLRQIQETLERMPPLSVEVAPTVDVQRALDLFKSIQADPKLLGDPKVAAAVAIAFKDVAEDSQAAVQAEDLLATLRTRSLEGLERQRAEAEQILRQTEKQIDLLAQKLDGDDATIKKLREQLAILREQSGVKLDDAAAKQTADIESKILGLRSSNLDKARELALATGDIARADSLLAAGIAARSALARDAADKEIAALRERAAGNAEALAAIERYAALLKEAAGAEGALAEATALRARANRAANTDTALGDARGSLLTGLDGELDAIERNRLAKIKSAQDGVRAGELEASKLGELIDLYNRVADAERAGAEREASLSRLEATANALGQLTDSYGAVTGAIRLAGDAERERLADSLAGMGMEQDQIALILAMQERRTAMALRGATIGFSKRSAGEIAEQELLNAAYDETLAKLQDGIILSDNWGQTLVDATSRALTGVEALNEGLTAGLEDFRRELSNDFAFGQEAGAAQARTFRDSFADALSNIGSKDGGDIFKDFVRANLEQLRDTLAKQAANQLTLAILGPAGANAVASPEDKYALAVQAFDTSVTRFGASIDRLLAAPVGLPAGLDGGVVPTGQGPLPLGIGPAQGPGLAPVDQSALTFQLAVERFAASVAVMPGVSGLPPGFDLLPAGAPIGPPNVDFLPAGAPPGFIGPQLEESAQELSVAGQAASDALTAGATASAGALVAGGDAAAGAFMSGLLGQLGSQLTSGITSFLGGAFGFGPPAGFQHGGIVTGGTRRPQRAQFGGVYRKKTLLEVAEVPGLEEAVIPLKGGAVPVAFEGPGGARMAEERRREQESQRATESVLRASRERTRSGSRGSRRDRGESRRRGDVSVSQPVTVGPIEIRVEAGAGGAGQGDRDLERRLLALAPQLRREIASALQSGLDRKLIEAVREATGRS